MKATQELRNEHKGIKLMLSILEKVCDRGKALNQEHMERILDFFTVFVDKCHHGKEEDFLFPALQSVGVPRDGGPIGVMLAEHEKGRGFVKGMKEAFSSHRGGNNEAVSSLIQNAGDYIRLLTGHIDKEEGVLFKMADELLNEARQEGLWIEFEKLEAERIGAGRHEEFHELLRELKGIYQV